MSILLNDKTNNREVLLAGTSPVDPILNPTSKNAVQNKAVYNALAEKVEKAVDDLINYYTKSDVYNKSEVRELIGAVNTLTIEVVNSLPASDISTTTIYFLKQSGSNAYDEYVYVNNAWVKIGDTNIDLTQYETVAAFNTAIANYYTQAQVDALLDSYYTKSEVNTELAGKQDTLTFDSTPTTNSTNPVTSGGVKTVLDAKQNALTFDATPTNGSSNPVTSDGIFDAITGLLASSVTSTSSQAPTGAAVQQYIYDKLGGIVTLTGSVQGTSGDTDIQYPRCMIFIVSRSNYCQICVANYESKLFTIYKSPASGEIPVTITVSNRHLIATSSGGTAYHYIALIN